MVQLGVMQGRLLPKYKNQYQAHPVGYWQGEFKLAAQFGLDCIEFILDYDDLEKNPLIYNGGIDEILTQVASSGVVVETICCDYLMRAPLHSKHSEQRQFSLHVLHQVIRKCSKLEVNNVVIPCVDESSINNLDAQARFVQAIKPAIEIAEEQSVNLALETDLNPIDTVNLLERIGSEYATVNYDTGNSAALGYDTAKEISTYGSRITDVHVKDRTLGGGPVKLGEGNAKIKDTLKHLSLCQYAGPFILQAFRDDEGLEVFSQQLSWFKDEVDKYFLRDNL